MIPSETKLSLRDVSKSFGARGDARPVEVLDKITFDVYDGEIVSLIGASGCGKTTLLRVIQGLVHHDQGIVKVGGEISNGPGDDRGFVFQQANLLPWRTALDNVVLGLEIQGVPKKERIARASQLLDLVGLADWSDQYPHELSGGMQQRVGLARALAIDPEILLMDEPFSALDAQTREVMQSELLTLQQKTGKTILFVTHDLDEGIYLSSRIVVLGARPGRVKRVLQVPFDRPRPSLPELRAEPQFQEMRTEIWTLIRDSFPETMTTQ